MSRLILGALVALATVAAGAVLGEVADAPAWLTVTGAVLTAVAVPTVAFPSLAALMARLPEAVLKEITWWVTIVVTGGEAVVLLVPDIETWIRVVLGVLVALAGAAGIRLQVTPTIDPKNDAGEALVPVSEALPPAPVVVR